MNKKARPQRKKWSTEDLIAGVLDGNRALLARAITLIESQRPQDREPARDVLRGIRAQAGNSVRVGISGVPGVGKSTFIENFGSYLTANSKQVAVLAVDPTSERTGGSILGDKTRMQKLATNPHAFIRPTPTAGSLGGVASRTRESIQLCEAAGYDVILVETVGVGQSETLVAGLVDFFLVLMLPTAGDELQGIKRGILELCDMIAINKCDLDATAASIAQHDYRAALRFMPRAKGFWQPIVQQCSALKEQGLEEIWQQIEQFITQGQEQDQLQQLRNQQQISWVWQRVEQEILSSLHKHPKVMAEKELIETAIHAGELSPAQAIDKILSLFDS